MGILKGKKLKGLSLDLCQEMMLNQTPSLHLGYLLVNGKNIQ